jgi:hypothetical protein
MMATCLLKESLATVGRREEVIRRNPLDKVEGREGHWTLVCGLEFVGYGVSEGFGCTVFVGVVSTVC